MIKAVWFWLLDVAAGVALKYPRRTVQWPRPYGGYLPESKSHRICVDTRMTMTLMDGVIDDNSEVVVTAYRSMLSELRLGAGHLKCPAEDGFWVKYIEVTVTEDEIIGPGVDESYKLSIVDGVLEITAKTAFGARHGMVTFHNMLQVENTRPVSAMKNGAAIRSENPEDFYYFLPYELSSFKIEDRPRVSHRGVMIDTGNNFVRVGILKRILDVMARAKFNVFHWHTTDRIAMSVFTPQAGPRLHGTVRDFRAALSKIEYYDWDTVKEIQDYALNRGIRLIPEVDAPANIYSWQFNGRSDRTEPACLRAEYQSLDYCDRPPCHVMTLPEWVVDIQGILADDWYSLVPGWEHIHVGFHGYDFNCSDLGRTAETQLVDAWAILGIKHKVWRNRFIIWASGRLREITNELDDAGDPRPFLVRGKTILQTEEIYTEKKNVTVLDQLTRAQEILDDGFDIIYSANPLNCGFEHSWDYRRPDICPYTLWWDLYKVSPDLLLSQEKGKVLGAEALMYTYYADSDTIESFLWPRAVALAGALWEQRDSIPQDPVDQTTIDLAYQAYNQINHFHDMIFNLGPVPYTPLTNRWCINDDEEACKQFASCIYKGCAA